MSGGLDNTSGLSEQESPAHVKGVGYRRIWGLKNGPCLVTRTMTWRVASCGEAETTVAVVSAYLRYAQILFTFVDIIFPHCLLTIATPNLLAT